MKTAYAVRQAGTEFQRPATPDTNAAPQPNGKAKTYKDLRIWQHGIELVERVYATTDRFPKEEAAGLAAQMRQAAVSIPSDVAEGHVRRYAREYTPFLYSALGACARLETQLFVSAKRRYLGPREIEALSAMIGEETGMLIGLIRAIQRNEHNDKRAPRLESPAPF